jgi:hypothetical protein
VSFVIALGGLRKRLPLVAFVLVLLVAVLVLGFACACITDHPTTAIERALTTAANVPPLVMMWSLLVLLLAPAATMLVRTRPAVVRGSPAELQRFLF